MIVTHRCREHLRRCLAGLAANRDAVRMEVEVVDTASGDGTTEPARALPWVRVTELPENAGFARANNLALRRARGRAVLVLNPDTVIPPDALRSLLDALWRRPEVGVLTPRLVTPAGDLDPRCRRGFPTVWSSLATLAGLDRRLRGPRSGRYLMRWRSAGSAHDVVSVSGAFMLMRAEALREAGGFDERYFMYAEDMDLCLRLAARGWRAVYLPAPEVLHVGGGSAEGGRPAAAEEAFFLSMGPFLRRWRPGPRGALQAAAVTAGARGAVAGLRLRRRLRRGGQRQRGG